MRNIDRLSPQEVVIVTDKTPGDLISVPDHALLARLIKAELNAENRSAGKGKQIGGDLVSEGMRSPCCGLTLACSVYRTQDQLGDVK